MDLKTLGRHREAGNLPVHIKGTGLERRHYVCTLTDVAEFYRKMALDNRPNEPSEPKPPKPAIRLRRRIVKTGRKAGNRVKGFIYFVTDGEFIKIGWSQNWKRRVAILQIANPRPLKVLAVCVGTVLDENRLHQSFDRHRSSGEWHTSHADILAHIAGLERVDL